MNNDQILSALEAEKAELEKNIRGAQTRIADLTTAIAALRGQRVDAQPPEANDGPSVADMLTVAAKQFGAADVFDHRKLLNQAGALYVGQHEKLKRGIYSGTEALVRRKVIVRAPGGFTLAPPSTPPPA